jgi:hypothetical protein
MRFMGFASYYEALDKDPPVPPNPPLVTLLGAPDGRDGADKPDAFAGLEVVEPAVDAEPA